METLKLILAVIAIIIAPLAISWVRTRFALASSRSESGLELETSERKGDVRSIRQNCELVHKRVDEKLEGLDHGQGEVRDEVKCVSKKLTALLVHADLNPGDYE